MYKAMIVWMIAVMATGTAVVPSLEVFAQGEQKFTAILSAEEEVPPTDSDDTSLAELTVMGDSVQYSVTGLYSNLQNVTAGHIHSGKQGENGPVIVTLFKYDSPKSQVTENGTITADKLEGPMAGKQLTDLITAINNGETYVNIHTVPNPNGEVRGQIMRS
jgi:hypothetical protein